MHFQRQSLGISNVKYIVTCVATPSLSTVHLVIIIIHVNIGIVIGRYVIAMGAGTWCNFSSYFCHSKYRNR